MPPKHLITLAVLLFVSLVAITPQLFAVQSVNEVENRKAELVAAQGNLARELQSLEKEQVVHQEKIDRLGQEITEVERQHFENGISSESFAEIVRTLQTQRVQLMIDLAGLDARQQAVQEYNAAKTANPLFLEVVNKMQEQVSLHKAANDQARTLYQQAAGSMGEYREAQRELLAAEIQLRQMQLSNSDSPDQATDELRQIALERAEKAARLSKSLVLLQGLANVPEELRSLDRLQHQEQLSRERLLLIEAQQQRLQEMTDQRQRVLDDLTPKHPDDN